MKQSPLVRERTEELERASLSTWATLAAETKGRDRYEEPDRLRTTFQQDRDRILGCRAFRRLKDKSQTLTAPEGRDKPVRMTHTLAVVAIARTVARALRLNEDLTEAIALGHDLGHTAFADAGEDALSAFTDTPFLHNEQGLRIVERIEGGGRGLNLTWEVRDGILHHTAGTPMPATLEGQTVRVADRIALAAGDLDDALDAGVVVEGDLPDLITRVLGATSARRLTSAVEDVVDASFVAAEVAMTPAAAAAFDALERFLAERVHGRAAIQAERGRAMHCLRSLVVFYVANPERLPAHHRGEGPGLDHVVDFVAGVTDAEAVSLFTRLFLPTSTLHRA